MHSGTHRATSQLNGNSKGYYISIYQLVNSLDFVFTLLYFKPRYREGFVRKAPQTYDLKIPDDDYKMAEIMEHSHLLLVRCVMRPYSRRVISPLLNPAVG